MECHDGMLKLNFGFGKLCSTARFFSFCKGVLMANSTVLLFDTWMSGRAFPAFIFILIESFSRSLSFVVATFFSTRGRKKTPRTDDSSRNEIVILSHHLSLKRNLKTIFFPSLERNKDPLKKSRLWWMVAACLLTNERTRRPTAFPAMNHRLRFRCWCRASEIENRLRRQRVQTSLSKQNNG